MILKRHLILAFLIIFISLLSPFFSSASDRSNTCFSQADGELKNIQIGRNHMVIHCDLSSRTVVSFNSQAITGISLLATDSPLIKRIDSHEYAFDVPKGKTKFTIELESDFTVPLRLRFSDPNAYDLYKQQHNAVMYGFLSFCIALALYVLILGRSLHSSYFYTYAGYITVTALFFASQERIFSLFLAPDSWFLHYKFATILAGASLLIGQLFISGLLDFKRNIPSKLYFVIRWLALGLFGLSISALVVPLSVAKTVQLSMGYFTLVLMLSMLIGMAIAFKKRIHCSGLVLASSLVMLTAMIMRIIFVDYSEFLARYALVFAIMIDAFILSFAISEKVKLLYSEKVKATEKANLDPLTGVYNKRGWYQAVSSQLQQLHTQGSAAALLYIDMDKFKVINDNYGHDVGDQALRHLTNLLNHQTKGTDVIGRVGGDEFVVLACFNSLEQVQPFAERITNQLNEMEIAIGQTTLSFSASVGLHVITEPVDNLEAAMHESDSKMYQAKAAKLS